MSIDEIVRNAGAMHRRALDNKNEKAAAWWADSIDFLLNIDMASKRAGYAHAYHLEICKLVGSNEIETGAMVAVKMADALIAELAK